MGYVHQIHDQLIVGRGVVLAINLGVPGEPCFGLEAQAELRQILLILGGDLRPLGAGTTDGHISLQNVQQLGQLVDADFSDNPAHGSDAVVLIAGGETATPSFSASTRMLRNLRTSKIVPSLVSRFCL